MDHIDMASFAVVWIQIADRTGDCEAPVTSLCCILIVTEGKHQFVASLCILCSSEATLFRSFTETKIRKRGGNNMEGWSTRL